MDKFLEKHEKAIQRALEIAPGLLAWGFILFPFWGSFFMPRIVAYITIAFLVYWFYRSFLSAALGVIGYFKIKKSNQTDWRNKYQLEKGADSLEWNKIQHLVVIPNYMESVAKIAGNLSSLANQKDIDIKKLHVVLAMEERAAGHKERAAELTAQFAGKFGHLWVTIHPEGLVGEIKGKASNEAWGAKEAEKKLLKLGYRLENITITSCDADAIFHPRYFSALTYNFAVNQNRYLRFWQSPIFWYNNLYRVPTFTRIVGILGNVIHVASLQEPDRLLFNYSCYSSSLKLLDGVGFWHTNIIPEDWHVFLQAFFHNQGKVEVEPIFLPTSIDAPEGATYLGSLKARYEQCKRHAWGATDIPYAVKEAIRHPEIPFLVRFFRIFKIIETHFIWSTNWFILTLGALIPTIVNPVFQQTALGYNLPKISQFILTVCLASLVFVIVLDMMFRPPKPKGYPLWRSVFDYLQWLTMPIATLLMSVLPGLDSQTRLMIGKRLEYWVTEKFD